MPFKVYFKIKFDAIYLALFILVAYLPLASFLFALKNDAFIYNFPNKYFFSQTLHSGQLPFWNPYLNYGFPIFADPGFAWWHPITWIFGLIGYTPYTFTIELLVYIYIAALGMYWLGQKLSFSRHTCIVIACMFSASGFFVGNMQHINFITCASFIPWLIGSWLQLQEKPSLAKVIIAAISTYLLCTAGHPAIPIGTIYFFTFFCTFYFVNYRKTLRWRPFLKWNILYLVLSILLLLLPFLSWNQLMPFYQRSEIVNQITSDEVGFTPGSYLSFFYPFATVKGNSFFQTDISMRNGYFSLLGILCLIGASTQKNKIINIFLGTSLLMMILSMGGTTKQFLYSHLPLLKFIRTNGEYRVFVLLGFIICAGTFVQACFEDSKKQMWLRKGFKLILLSSLSFAITFLFIGKSLGTDFKSKTFSIFAAKEFLDRITFQQSLLFSTILTLLITSCYLLFCKDNRKRFFIYVLAMDLVLNTWLLLPATGVGMHSVLAVSKLLSKSPVGFPNPSMSQDRVITDKPISYNDELRIGSWSWYDKKIVHEKIDYPSGFKRNSAFFLDSLYLNKSVFAYLKQSKGYVAITSFSPNHFAFNVSTTSKDTLLVLQNSYPGWTVIVNNKRQINNESRFLEVAVASGASTIHLNYFPNF